MKTERIKNLERLVDAKYRDGFIHFGKMNDRDRFALKDAIEPIIISKNPEEALKNIIEFHYQFPGRKPLFDQGIDFAYGPTQGDKSLSCIIILNSKFNRSTLPDAIYVPFEDSKMTNKIDSILRLGQINIFNINKELYCIVKSDTSETMFGSGGGPLGVRCSIYKGNVIL